MANSFITASAVSKIATAILENNLVMPRLMHTGYTKDFATVGETIWIPTRATASAYAYGGSSVTYEDVTESSTSITLDQDFIVAKKISAKQKTLHIEDFTEQVIAPAMRELADLVDADLLQHCGRRTPYWVGAAGTVPSEASAITTARRTIFNNQGPINEQYNAVINPNAEAELLNLDRFVEADKRGKSDALTNAKLGHIYNTDFYVDQNVDYHTVGTVNASTNMVLDANAAKDATSIALSGFSAATDVIGGTVLEGDSFTMASSQYCVTASAGSSASGSAITVSISPGLTASAAAGETITFLGGGTGDPASLTANTNYANNLLFAKDAYSVAWAKLAPPIGGAEGHTYQDTRMGGIAVTAVYDWDQASQSDTLVFRILYGRKVVNPKLGCRIIGESNLTDV
jgi:hypothetical protein